MIRPMFGKQPKPRKFEMPLRYYDPKEDEKRKKRLKIERNFRKRKQQQNTRIIIYAIGLAFVVWLISIL